MCGEDLQHEFFDVDQTGDPRGNAPVIQPWRKITLDPQYAGAWVVVGDVDGDGQAEIVSARNVDSSDVHYTSTAVAQRLDGSVLWRWGDPTVGRKKLHHDVACQIYDWDGDGRNEVVLCTNGFLVELDGTTGEERRRLPLPKDASDCLTFANFSGNARATDVMVKKPVRTDLGVQLRLEAALDGCQPGRISHGPHQCVPVDLDGDGRDEVMAGYAMLNADGSVRLGREIKAGRPPPRSSRLLPRAAGRRETGGLSPGH